MFALKRSKHALASRRSASHIPHVCRVVSSRRCLARHRKASTVVRSSADPDDLHETKLGPNVAAGINDVKKRLQWSPGTVIRNDSANLDGTHRLLHLSVADEVDMLYGRKIQAVPDSDRWIDSFTVPGQFVGVRPAGASNDEQHLYTIACSPYDSRRDSAYKSGSIIEVAIDKGDGAQQSQLGDLAPGESVEVSQVVGRGFASLFNSYSGLPSSLEEQRPILAIAVGFRGMAAMRAVLNWAPVQAHATSHKVTCYYVTKSPSAAAFIQEWDTWREAGVNFTPLYTESLLKNRVTEPDGPGTSGNGGSSSQPAGRETVTAEDINGLLEQALYLHEHGIESVIGGRPSEATVLLAGLSGDIASTVAKDLTFKGVAWDRLLFSDYF